MDFETPRFITQHPETLAALRSLTGAEPRSPVVTSGPRGAGKTTLAHWLARRQGARPPWRVEPAAAGAGLVAAIVAAAAHGPVIVEDADQLPVRAQLQLALAARQRPLELHLTLRGDGGENAALERLGLAPELATVVGNRHVRLPPLAARRSDIALLADHLRPAHLTLEPAALRLLVANNWPDNVKGLHAVLRASAHRARSAGARTVSAAHVEAVLATAGATASLGAGLRELVAAWESGETFDGLALPQRVRLLEATLLVRALHGAGGNAAQAARSMGMPPSSLKSRLAALAKEADMVSAWIG